MKQLAINVFLLTGILTGCTCLNVSSTEANRPIPLPPPTTTRAAHPTPIIYFFTRPDCIYCRPMRRLANQLHREGHTIYVVDPSRQDLVQRYGVSAYPTFLVVEGDTVVRRVIGLTTKERIVGE
ncbi:thioredoxin family protein [Bremerella sp. JC770]|uniref:thioredoxin family protein n=1 Tax=Bremerella sp. JC770 TaxID=3232137 RepID=UPI00345A2079